VESDDAQVLMRRGGQPAQCRREVKGEETRSRWASGLKDQRAKSWRSRLLIGCPLALPGCG
jgi:hypothetical protein